MVVESRSVIRKVKSERGLGRDRAATAPFPKSRASYFRFARFNTFPLHYLRAWHRLIERTLFSHDEFGKYLIVISLILFWLSLQIVNFRFIPVAHQLNFCLAVSLVWATILSVIRASETSHLKEIESKLKTLIYNKLLCRSDSAVTMERWSLEEERKKIHCANFCGCHISCPASTDSLLALWG